MTSWPLGWLGVTGGSSQRQLSGVAPGFGTLVVLCQGPAPQEGGGVISCKRPKAKGGGVQPGEAGWPCVGMDGVLDGTLLGVCPGGRWLSWFFVTGQG